MMENPERPAAILWDMDGTLIDTEPYWMGAETALCAAHGVTWTHEDGIGLIGNPLSVSGRALQERGLDLPIEDIVDALLTDVTARVDGHVPWQADARELFDRWLDRGVPFALVTMSYRSLADAFIGDNDWFDAIVTGETVERGKPDPEPYLTAAAMLGVPIERCLAIEDSPSGVRSALASGAAAVGVRRLAPVDPLPGLSRVRSLDALTDDAVARLLAREVIDELGDER